MLQWTWKNLNETSTKVISIPSVTWKANEEIADLLFLRVKGVGILSKPVVLGRLVDLVGPFTCFTTLQKPGFAGFPGESGPTSPPCFPGKSALFKHKHSTVPLAKAPPTWIQVRIPGADPG